MAASKAQRAAAAERRTKLIQFRIQGVNFDDPRVLGLGYTSRGAATKDLIRALDQRQKEQSAEATVYRQQENERLDALLEAVWPRATQPHPVFDREGLEVTQEIDVKAIDTVLKLMDRRAKLNGLDMPVRTEISGPDGGAIPFNSGELNELKALIDISGDPDAEVPAFNHEDHDDDYEEDTETAEEDDDDDSDG